MPGVLVVEAMAQVGGVLASFLPGSEGHTAYFAAIDRCRFRRPVRPGDQLITEAVVLRARSRIGQMRATGRVDGVVVAEGTFTYSMAPLDRGPGGVEPAGPAAGSDSMLREETPRAGR
jgi:3-hydroxyacyl-[acyl-carrier-protein] dehydratase